MTRARLRPAELYGGPLDGTTFTRHAGQGWPDYLDAATGEPLTVQLGGRALRGVPGHDVGVYVREDAAIRVPAPATAARQYSTRLIPVADPAPRFVHSAEHPDRGLAWLLIARALAGTHTGRVLTGGSNDESDVLDALVGDVDDLIRLRHRRDFPMRRTQDNP